MPELEEGFLDAAGGGGCDALVDGKCLFQAGSGFAGVAVAKMAAADAVETATRAVIAEGRTVTHDLGGTAGTREFGEAVAGRVRA